MIERAILPVLFFCVSCSPQGASAPDEQREPETATLYRNSALASELRIHWATFDAEDRVGYNINNCRMAARLLNANLKASAEAEEKIPYPDVGFWCELGPYKIQGSAPTDFDAAYPTDV